MSEAQEGIQGVDITTAGHLFNPKDTFALTEELNKGKNPDDWAQIEVYPTLEHKPLALIRALSKRFGLELPIPPGVTEQQIRDWQKEYSHTKVARVHVPFSYNRHELFQRATPFIGGERDNGLKQTAYQILWMFYFGAATNMKGVELARGLADQEVGINAHANVIEGFAKDQNLGQLKDSVAFVLAENERKYNSPILKDPESIANPIAVIRNIVDKYDLDGLVFGVDHALEQGMDPTAMLQDPSIKRATTAMHLAQSHHDVLAVGSNDFERFLEQASRTKFDHPVRAALDYNPMVMSKLSGSQQLELVRDTIDWITKTQKKV